MSTGIRPGTPPTLFQDENGLVWAKSPMPEYLEISEELLAPQERVYPGFKADGDIIDFHLANGRWIYEIVERRPAEGTVVGHLRFSEEG